MHVDHSQNIIEIDAVSFSYGAAPVLDSITFQIHKGDYLGIVGPNGAGKTTLLNIMLGILPAKSGSVKLFGKEVGKFKEWFRIGYVSQKATQVDANFPATVGEVVTMGRLARKGLFKMLGSEDKKAVDAALADVDMLAYKNRLIGDLSGGQQQRVFIARALAGNPEIIFLDEPTTGIDQAAQDSFYALLKKLNKELHLTLVLITHDVERILREGMHIACIDCKLVCHTSPEEFLKHNRAVKILGKELTIIDHQHA